METSTARRRIVKSPPELWSEVSRHDMLKRHLAPFGDIRIIRSEPETTVAWEGDRASGTVALEPAAWGTNVILTAAAVQRAAAPDTEVGPRLDGAGTTAVVTEVLDDLGSARHRPLSLD